MSDLYERMAWIWWNSLDSAERDRWLNAAEFDGRARDPIAAFTLKGDLASGCPVLYLYPTEGGEFGGQVVDGGKPICGIAGCATEAEVLETADGQRYGNIIRVRAGSLAEVPGFHSYFHDRAEAWAVKARAAMDRHHQAARRWWNRLNEQDRTEWLDRTEADGRERSIISAYTMMVMAEGHEQDIEPQHGITR